MDDTALNQILADCLRVWPDVEIDAQLFLDYLRERSADASPHVTDLYLACACGLSQRVALDHFERKFLSQVSAFIAQIDSSADFAEEVRQQLREKLLVHTPGTRAKIADYRGTGALGGWLRVASVRVALDLKRQEQSSPIEPARDSLPSMPAPLIDLELDYLKASYRDELQEALQLTLAGLPIDERNVMRLHYFDGLSIDEIGSLYKVHRATVARWLMASRETILSETRRILRDRLKLEESELDSVINLVQSRLEASRRFLPES